MLIEAAAESPGYLVLTDNNFPGWQAQVDGQPEEIFYADYILRAVQIPEGQHRVVFSYNPTGFRVGFAVSLAAFLCVVLLLGVSVVSCGWAARAVRG